MRLADLEPARVAIWGFGREGRASLAVIRRRFPKKRVAVFCAKDDVPAESISSDTVFVTDAPDAAMLSAFDIVIKSPGISAYRSPFPAAVATGVRFTSSSALWFGENPDAKTICVTGTKGKSTVTALIAHLLRRIGRRVALAGNIGLPLLELLDVPQPPDWWVIELSSFQTRDFDGAPTVAVINNLYEEHLDWHVTNARYAADKLKIAVRAKHLVVAAQPALLAATSADNRSAFGDAAGWHVQGAAIFRGAERVIDLSAIPLPGLHNAHNVCAALAAIDASGEDAIAAAPHVASFRALPHRLQPLGERDGIHYVNDTISTTPYASIEALRSVDASRATILVGGFDRGVSWHAFVDHVTQHPPHAVVTMGANGDAIAASLRAVAGLTLRTARALSDAVSQAQSMTPLGGTIVLSPGAPSFDQFRDYAQRGREFARLAGFDPSAISQIDGLGIA
jgi:UDP-N-acetylmuramoylalanine--D-glutamate ligase